MNTISPFSFSTNLLRRTGVFAIALLCLLHATTSDAQVTLGDQPPFSAADVPGNVALALSVEFPTAISVANIGTYSDSTDYLGYFDPNKCYDYNYNAGSPAQSFFQPASLAFGTHLHSCSGLWSGNFMNWASMQTIDPFRWVLSGGYRSVDSPTQTILEKAWGSTEGSPGNNFNYRGTGQAYGGANYLDPMSVPISTITPFTSWGSFDSGIWGNGNAMVFSEGSGYTLPVAAATDYADANLPTINSQTGLAVNTAYRVYIRVDVCDVSVMGIGGLESNCVQYPPSPQPGPYHYKPEGLMQKYSNKIRYSTLSYLNSNGYSRQGGVLRAPMNFIGPTKPQPLASPVPNPLAEWNGYTGQMIGNPNTASASASGVTSSGNMNFLNGFGEYSHNYMSYDNVSELYYATVRYYENLGNVPEWTNGATSSELDGFPAVTPWTDPILYSCQQNYIIGIGDDHTWYDYNVGGSAVAGGGGRPDPAMVAGDTFNQASTWTAELQALEGMSLNPFIPFDSGATDFIAGLAYGVHVNDIRPEAAMPGTQTISTFWMDVEEGGGPENNNQYYLAAKYGGFTVPSPYVMPTALATTSFDVHSTLFIMNGYQTHYLPDNYFLAGNAQGMKAGLNKAFSKIISNLGQFTTSFSYSSPNVVSPGTESFSTNYDPKAWSGTVTAKNLTFDTYGNPMIGTLLWTSDTTLNAQLAGSGWKTNRRIATWDPVARSAEAFEASGITPAQQATLSNLSYSTTLTCGSSSCPYLDYLRGDQTNEIGSMATLSTQSLRARALFLGDIVNASLAPVGPPIQTFSQGNDPGYPLFKSTNSGRAAMVYAAANDGMLHGFVGSTGVERFAYVPSGTFPGPTNTPASQRTCELGDPNYVHHYYVDATPVNFDIDLGHTYCAGGNANNIGALNWRTVLFGGMGKGGKSYYALDITDPVSNINTEADVVSHVLWEFTDPTMGYSYGGPVVVKTVKYGWVAVFTSGYDNSDGYGYLYFVNPATGALLEKVRTPTPSSGLTQASAYVKDYSDDTSDSIYVGDLNGQVWRFDLTQPAGPCSVGLPSSTPYPAPILFATITDSLGNPQPVTSAPLIEIHPSTRLRYVMFGTGRLLATSDIISNQQQTFYAILDGTAGSFLPVATPYTRANLVQALSTDLTGPGVPVPVGKMGWYTDLGIDTTSGIGWRVLLNPQAYNGIVSFSTLLTTANPCTPGGFSRVYAVNYGTVTSVLIPSGLPYAQYASDTVINERFTGANGNPEIVVGFSSTTPPQQLPANLIGTLATRLLNWREVPTAD